MSRSLAAFREFSNFASDDRKPFAVFTCSSGLNSGIECEQVGLVGDLLDDRDFLRDGFHGIDGFGDSFAGFLHVSDAFSSHLFHLTGVFSVLRDRGMHLFQAGAGFLYRGCLLAGSLR